MEKAVQFIKEHATAIVIGAISLISLILLIIVFTLASSGNGERRVVIEDISGSAFILKSDGQVSAVRKMSLESGDVLITSAESSVKITADRDKTIYIEPETTLYISYTPIAEKGSIVINISEGSAVCRLDSKLAKNAVFETRTPNAIISAKGTVFRTEFNYFDNYNGHEAVKVTDVDCAEGSVDIQLYDNKSEPVEQLMLLAEGKSARLMTNEEVSRYEFLNSMTEISSMSSDTLKTYIRIAAERQIVFSLVELNNAYQRILNNPDETQPFVSKMYPVTESTEAPTESVTSNNITSAVSSDTTAESSPGTTSETTTATSVTESTPILVTSPTSVIYTVSTGTEDTAVTTVPPDDTDPAETTGVTTAPAETTVPPIAPATTTTTTVTSESETTKKTTVSSVPWWEIINSDALT